MLQMRRRVTAGDEQNFEGLRGSKTLRRLRRPAGLRQRRLGLKMSGASNGVERRPKSARQRQTSRVKGT